MWPLIPLGLAVAGLGAWFVIWRRRWGPQLRVLKHGAAGTATVLDRNELETTTTGGGHHSSRRILYRGSLVLDVHRDGQPAYRAKCVQWFEGSSWSLVHEKATVSVRIDLADPQVVFIDTEAKLRELTSAHDAEREKHAKRQDELMKK
jgi:hypothetical protein